MTNIADFAKDIMKATFWLGCAIIVLVMTIMIVIGVVTGMEFETDTTQDLPSETEVINMIKHEIGNYETPQYYY